jgi:hypothetical protein
MLCDSHLIPAAAFKILRAQGSKNPHPIMFGEATAFSSSLQMRDYLLCRDCEELFHKNGEDWVMANCYRSIKTFALRDALQKATPKYQAEGVTVYAAAQIPGVNCPALIYFALSVFWRAGVHTWKLGSNPHHNDLGPYEEPIRLFLLGAGFPDNVCLSTRVSGLDSLHERLLLPFSERGNGYHMHCFGIPGLMFTLHVGKRIPKAFYHLSTAPNLERVVAMFPEAEMEELRAAGRVARSVRAPKGYPDEDK